MSSMMCQSIYKALRVSNMKWAHTQSRRGKLKSSFPNVTDCSNHEYLHTVGFANESWRENLPLPDKDGLRYAMCFKLESTECRL